MIVPHTAGSSRYPQCLLSEHPHPSCQGSRIAICLAVRLLTLISAVKTVPLLVPRCRPNMEPTDLNESAVEMAPSLQKFASELDDREKHIIWQSSKFMTKGTEQRWALIERDVLLHVEG